MQASSSTTAVLTEPAVDPNSLRALALSTLKAKRKRPAPQQPPAIITSRPVPTTDSFQLDYGQEDSTNGVHRDQDYRATVSNRQVTIAESGDVPMREEGEISDEEDAPSAKPPAPPTQLTRSTPTGPRIDKLQMTDVKSSLLDRISSIPAVQPVPPKFRPTHHNASPHPTPVQHRPFQISTEQVRPNLHMNQVQYDQAKDLILDLLGWGVLPEYLVECGLTREIVFYVFKELDLRLPTNLDTTDLVPYAPETIQNFAVIPSGPRHRLTPPPAIGHAVKPGVPQFPRTESVTAPSLSTPTPNGDLHDMERQRRQELIARKAVQASRRARAGAKDSKVPSVVNIPSTPSDAAVNDFLNSITPSTELKFPALPSNTMAVDSPISRVSSPNPSSKSDVGKGAPPSTTDFVEPPPSSTDSVTTDFTAMQVSTESTPVPDGKPVADSQPAVAQYPIRRGAKRPVASDFVDFDGYPRANGRTDSFEVQNAYAHRPVRRKTANSSFVNVRPTKCVIDLSDSESETEEDGGKPSPTPTVNMSTLEETEREIQRMRELIAQREQKSFLKKLKLKSLPMDSNGSPAGLATPAPADEAGGPSPSSTNILAVTPTVGFPPETSATAPSTALEMAPPHIPNSDLDIQMDLEGVKPNGDNAVETHIDSEENRPADQAQDTDDVEVTKPSPIQVSELNLNESDPSKSTDTNAKQFGFAPYDSLFALYPSLRLSSTWASADMITDNRMSFFSPSDLQSFLDPHLEMLRMIALTKLFDPTKQICQFEIPGGGTCCDINCDDLHLARLADLKSPLEPNDNDVARYLSNSIVVAPFSQVLSVLQDVRLKNPTSTFETRVAQVVKSLQPAPWISSQT